LKLCSEIKEEMNGDRPRTMKLQAALVPFMKTLHSMPYPEADEHTQEPKESVYLYDLSSHQAVLKILFLA
jgi:hypothetical protein